MPWVNPIFTLFFSLLFCVTLLNADHNQNLNHRSNSKSFTGSKKKIGIVGSGISGLGAAYYLHKKPEFEVYLFESGDYFGGHTHSVDVLLPGETDSFPVDTGFLVFNNQTYQNFIEFLEELGVSSYDSEMSFAVSLDEGDLEWGGSSLSTVFAQPKNILSFSFWGMLRDIMRFNNEAEENLKNCKENDISLGTLLIQHNYGKTFQDAYLFPMAMSIWSSSKQDLLEYPASSFLQFCMNHGLLQIFDRPQWRTIRNGARDYVERVIKGLNQERIFKNSEVISIEREKEGIVLLTKSDKYVFDDVIFATHPPEALKILGNSATPDEKLLLGKVNYQPNRAILHTDKSFLPKDATVWSSWNFIGQKTDSSDRPVCLSYLLNQLQDLPTDIPIIETLNPYREPKKESIIGEYLYEHPIITQEAKFTQDNIKLIQGVDRIWFTGAWIRWGFHEDGLLSALRVISNPYFNANPEWFKN